MEENNIRFLKSCQDGDLGAVEKSILFADVNVIEKK